MKPIHPSPSPPSSSPSLAGAPLAFAAESDPAGSSASEAGGIRELLRGISGMQRLPVAGMQMVEAGERVLFVSANGRYVFTGPAWDLWHGAKLESLDEAARLAERIDLKRLGLDPAALGALDLVVASGMSSCSSTPAAPTAGASLGNCRRSASATASAWCRCRCSDPSPRPRSLRLACLAEQDPSAARDALLAETIEGLPAPTGTCGQAPAQRALVTAQLLGIAGVPYLIAPDGRLQQGVPEDLEAWLEGKE